jgi:sirohydrochlorin ferrochelatase
MGRIALVVAASVALASCGSSPGGPPATTDVVSDGGSPSRAAERGLAVVAVAPRADDLDAATARLRDGLGPALVVSPVGCFEGLPSEAGEGYLIGAVAEDPAAAARSVRDAGGSVLFTASVTILCVD